MKMNQMPSLFALVSPAPAPLGDLLSTMIASRPCQKDMPVEGFVGDAFFSGKVRSISIPRVKTRYGVAQVGGIPDIGDVFVDAPTSRPELLDAGRLLPELWNRKPAREWLLFGSTIYRTPEGLVVGRDRLGTRPLFQGSGNITGFCSEPYALSCTGFRNVTPFGPSRLYWTNLGKTLSLTSQTSPVPTPAETPTVGELIEALSAAIRPLPSPRVVFFSGGIDSLILAKISEQLGETILISAGVEGCKDIIRAESAASSLSSPLEKVHIPLESIARDLVRLPRIIGTGKSMNLAIALPILHAAAKAYELGVESAITGQGADELFGGYNRYLSDPDPGMSMYKDLIDLHSRGMDSCDLAARAKGVDLFLPYLDETVLQRSLSLPVHMKIKDGVRKVILRRIGLELGLPPRDVSAKKCAIQYGSGVNKHISRILKSGLV